MLSLEQKVSDWVRTFNAVTTDMIKKLWEAYPEDWEEVTSSDSDEEEYYDGQLPMWGTMWSFDDAYLNNWLDRKGIEIMSKLGFRIFKSRDFGYFFGIDGAGYDFYSEHWVPLYKAIFNKEA